MTVTLFIEVAKETVAKIVLPTDSIYHVYRRRIPGGIAMAESTIIAVHRKAQLLWRNLNISQPERLGQLGGYGEEISPSGKRTLIVGASAVRSGLLSDFLTSATPSPEPAGLSSFLPLDSFLDTFSTFRLASSFGLPICTTVLLERGLIFWIISCRSAF